MKYNVKLNGKIYEVEVEKGVASLLKEYDAISAPAPALPAQTQTAAPAPADAVTATVTKGANAVESPLPGVVMELKVSVGAKVKRATSFSIEAMKMENEISASKDGTVTAFYVQGFKGRAKALPFTSTRRRRTGDFLSNLFGSSGFATMDWKQAVMILIACVLLYLGIVKKFEPLLLVGIAFGMLLTNLPGTGIYHPEMWFDNSKPDYMDVLQNGGLLDILYIGVKTSVYPCLIFLGVGAMTDFGPLLANPKSMLLGAAAQLGIYCAFLIAVCFFTGEESAAIAIIGGADGPTAIYVTNQLAPHLLGPIAVAAYSY
ncbi:MAG: sodium ion-translocating decarboxylase subunit beta, partial [Christensenellales bacterium]